MEKIKSAISGHRKEGDTTSPTTNQAGKESSGDIPHPIYDQFTQGHASGEPTRTSDNAPHFSNTTNLRKDQSTSALGTSALRPDAALTRPGAHNEEMSTASIKSGIAGQPQGMSHPQQTLGGDQVFGGSNNFGARGEPGIDGPIDDGKGRFGAPASSRVMEDETYDATHTPDMSESIANTGTDRAFPLAGGVTHSIPSEKIIASEREPRTMDKDLGVRDGQGREALAGAAAAATSSSVHSQENERHVAFRGSPEANSDQAVRPAPVTNDSIRNLHIPGEFPSPTPGTQSSAPSYFQSQEDPSTSPAEQHELRHTGTLDPQIRSTEEPIKPEHHYGRDAAVAGGLGAAGAGAYVAGKHDQQESAQSVDNILPIEPSPYSSKQIDPRVNNRPAPSYDQQKFDPTTSTKQQGRDAVLTGGSLPTNSQPQPATQPAEDKSQYHHGRDAALLGAGAGAATTAGMYASQRANEPDSGPAKSTIGPHKSDAANIMDPRVQPDPALQKHHYAAPTADDPAPSTVGPHKSDVANIIDPRVLPDPQKQKAPPKEEHQYGRDAAVAGGTGAAGYGAYEAAGQPTPVTHQLAVAQQHYNSTPAQAPVAPQQNPAQPIQQPQESQHHYGRDAAVVGGLGAAGAGAYAATRGDDRTPQPAFPQQRQVPTQPSSQAPLALVNQQHQRYDSVQDPNAQHQKRDAAALGATGAGVYAYSQHQRDVEKEHQEAQKVQEQQLKEQHKKFEKELRERDKEAEKVHHDGEGEKKKHGILGFLHRDKDKRRSSDEKERRASGDSPRHSKEYAGAGAAAGVGGAAAYEGLHDSDSDRKTRNKLHKEPPPGHPAREAMEHQQQQEHQRSPIAAKRDHVGSHGAMGDQPISSGIYSNDDSYSEQLHHTVIEPHTGLPMNVEKYGTGAGGTDGNPNLVGAHELSPEARHGHPRGEGVTDWDAIKKSNTPY